MTVSLNSNYEARSQAGERVAAWKKDVQSFFATDWCRLRTLMMVLEEESWDCDSVGETHKVSGRQCEIDAEQPRAPDTSVMQDVGGTTVSESRPTAHDRLSALAEQIERQLQNAIAVGR